MADTSSNRAPAAAPIAEDDPFAELTRIMGFDPRVKVHQPAEPVEPDFGLDLERELLGEFHSDQDNVPAQALPRAAEPVRHEPVFTEEPVFAEEPVAAEAELEVPVADAYHHASAAAVEAQQADGQGYDFHETVDTFVADEPEAAVEPEVDPFADFELSFDEDDTISTNDLGYAASTPVEAATPVVEPASAPAAEEDDEIEAAYAALEAWQQNRDQQAPQPTVVEEPEPEAAAPVAFEPVQATESVQPENELDAGVADEQPVSDAAVDPLDLELAQQLTEAIEEPVVQASPSYETDLAYENDLEALPVQLEPHAQDEQTDADLIGDLDLDALDETEAEASDERAVFTAEEGWLDEGSISLDEPLVLSEQDELPPQNEQAEAVSEAPEQWQLVEPEAELQATPAHDEAFERELFDLLGGEMDSQQAAETSLAAPEDDSWLRGIDFAEAGAPDHRTDTQAFDGQRDEAQSADPQTGDALWNLDFSEVDTAPAAAATAAPLAYAAFQPEPAPVSQPQEDPADEPDFGDFEMADLMDDDAVARDIEAAIEAEVTQPRTPEMTDFAAVSASVAAANAFSNTDAHASAEQTFEPDTTNTASTTFADPVEEPAQPDMEPEAMQPFDERAFDAALADELAADPYHRDSDHNTGYGEGAAAGYGQSAAAGYGQTAAAGYGYAAQGRPMVNAPSMRADVPDIETVDFVDQRLAHSDELDLPDVDYGREPAPRGNGFDDFDPQFDQAFHSMNHEQAAQARGEELDAHRPANAQNWDEHLDFSMGAAAAGAAAGASAGRYDSDLSRAGMYEPEDEDGYYEQAPRTQPRQSLLGRRGMVMAGAAAAIVLIGGVAMLAMPSGSTGSGGEATLVRADTDPMKVRPENPGGTTVPNQDNVVYDRVGSGQPLGAPTQERLISENEAPVDLNAQEAEDSMASLSALDGDGSEFEGTDDGDVDNEAVGTAGKAEDRLMPDAAGSQIPEEMVAVAPRRVRTMVVRPDGSLAPREEAAAPAPQLASAAEAVTAEPASIAPTAAPSLPEASDTVESMIDETPAAQPAPQAAPQVAAVAPTAQAATAPAAVDAAAAPSGWAVQIASQPSEAAAQASYDNLSRRYASVLGGKNVNIVRADIAGKGTYYRVRVAASSRAEANTICANYKSAGGSCFVSQ
ncbi:SPOR domain-containing protein [Tianweitania sp. BSSL-BM11]|uniref:SPOR domain-containing protein n=1 Tax=Tianweitania aestuarii TaxID=2814886 RepID=A0ABS5RUK0_9HYPH|nr:SPOR domain-containing protein [Tianweitania aestuarii]MBS9720679.1 SPOR domain-containing protein [Tianweitania aestuarii]